MTQVVYDNKDQYNRIADMVIPGETLYAVYDMKGGGTGFVGITDLRLIFMDQSFVRKSKALVSLPYTKLTAIGVEDTGRSLLSFAATSKLLVTSGDKDWEFEFRSNEKARDAYMLIMRNLLQSERRGMG